MKLPSVETDLRRGDRDRFAGRAGGLPGPGVRRRCRAAPTGRVAARRPRPGGGLPRGTRRVPDRRARPVAAGRRRRRGDRPLQAAGGDRRRGHGRRLHGRADAPDPPPGGPEGHQARHGLPPGDRPVRGRAAGPGADGPPQHRPGPRRRHDRVRAALLRDGAGPRPADHRLLRPREPAGPASGWSCSSWSAGPCSTPTRRGSSTAT